MDDKLLPIVSDSYIALSNEDLINSKNVLIEWCTQRLTTVKAHLKDFQENLNIAVKNKWRVLALRAAVSRTKTEVNYYRKIKLAVEAGYLIIPNFPIDVFAVRTVRNNPPRGETESWNSSSLEMHGSAATPPGEGKYVSNETLQDQKTYGQGKDEFTKYWNVGFQAVAWPITAAKPLLVQAADTAMILKIFDELGIARGVKESTRKDPVLIGKIIGPGTGYSRKEISFFIAWWLNIEDI